MDRRAFSTKICTSFDELIRSRQYRWRDREPERFRGLHVDRELEPLRPLDGQISRLRTAQDLRNVNAAAAEGLTDARAIAQQAASVRECGEERHAREPLLAGERREPCAVTEDHGRREDDDRSGSATSCCLQTSLELSQRTTDRKSTRLNSS